MGKHREAEARRHDFGEIYVNKVGPEQLQGFHTGYRLSGMGGDEVFAGYPRQMAYNVPLETLFTVIPIIMVLTLWGFTDRVQRSVDTPVEASPLTVQVYGKQWAWDFNYLSEDVWDTGTGIAPEHQAQVFDEFYQVSSCGDDGGERKRGLGLGLATVRRLAELVGCDVRLASRPRVGTLVSVVLDTSQARLGPTDEPADMPLDISGLRVLVVDDEASILEGLRALLQEWGCDIRIADNEATALLAVADWAQPPDLVISDLRLREGRTGLDVLRALARRYDADPQRPPFARLLVTGETRPDRIGEIAANRIPVLFKPVSPSRLREAMLASVFASRAAP